MYQALAPSQCHTLALAMPIPVVLQPINGWSDARTRQRSDQWDLQLVGVVELLAIIHSDITPEHTVADPKGRQLFNNPVS